MKARNGHEWWLCPLYNSVLTIKIYQKHSNTLQIPSNTMTYIVNTLHHNMFDGLILKGQAGEFQLTVRW